MMADDSLTARNRINQRNFRARRQNYIKELEEKIRTFENNGVQASIAVQTAARRVETENVKLRSLLTQRFGMTDPDISNFLGIHQYSSMQPALPYSNTYGPDTHLANLGPAPALTTALSPRPPLPAELTQSYPTPPQQAESSNSSVADHLDPALSLAILHRYPSVRLEQRPFPELTPSRQNSDHSTNQSCNTRPFSYEARAPDSPTDTLSESSNPATPAEQMLVDNPRYPPFRSHSQSTAVSCCKPTSEISSTPKLPRANDETACEEAARIIAGMRGGDGTADQVMLELGCQSPESKCQVKNMSIFQLMDKPEGSS